MHGQLARFSQTHQMTGCTSKVQDPLQEAKVPKINYAFRFRFRLLHGLQPMRLLAVYSESQVITTSEEVFFHNFHTLMNKPRHVSWSLRIHQSIHVTSTNLKKSSVISSNSTQRRTLQKQVHLILHSTNITLSTSALAMRDWTWSKPSSCLNAQMMGRGAKTSNTSPNFLRHTTLQICR